MCQREENVKRRYKLCLHTVLDESNSKEDHTKESSKESTREERHTTKVNAVGKTKHQQTPTLAPQTNHYNDDHAEASE